jgi:hypothetical protein
MTAPGDGHVKVVPAAAPALFACVVCGEPAEVWLPDGEGDQVGVCGLCERVVEP